MNVIFKEITESRFNFLDGRASMRSVCVKPDDCNVYALQDSCGLLYAFYEYNKALGEIHYYERLLNVQ